MSRVMVIGIDALDSTTLARHADRLPNFTRMREDAAEFSFDGVFPPDSPTSWASIYTGLSPGRHGIVKFIDPLKRVSSMISEDVDDTSIRGKTFWDYAGANGNNVCIMPHLLGYPPWKVNGVMIGRSGVTGDIRAYPEYLADEVDLSEFRWELENFPGRDKHAYLKKARTQIEREHSFGLKMLRKDKWDLFFLSFGELDSIQYSFWHYYDQHDPSYPGQSEFQDVIPAFYSMFDRLVGSLFAADRDAIKIVVSDHGIGSRPTKLVNINEILRRENLIRINPPQITKKKLEPGWSISRNLRKKMLRAVSEFDLGNVAAAALKAFPRAKDWYLSSQQIDWEGSTAYLTDQSGIKNYPYGGIVLRRKSMTEKEYQILRDSIIDMLIRMRDPDDNQVVFRWLKNREDLYTGDKLEEYPDILFELRDDYGAGTSTPAPLFDTSISHKIVPGCHRQHNATFLISNIEGKKIGRNTMNLMDVTPTILHLLEADDGRRLDGESVIA